MMERRVASGERIVASGEYGLGCSQVFWKLLLAEPFHDGGTNVVSSPRSGRTAPGETFRASY